MLHGIVKTGTIAGIGLLGINGVAANGITLAAAGSTLAAGLPIIGLYLGYRILSGTFKMAGTVGNGVLLGLGAYLGQRLGRALSRGLNQTERAAAASRIAQRSGVQLPQPRQTSRPAAAATEPTAQPLAAFRAPTAARNAPPAQPASTQAGPARATTPPTTETTQRSVGTEPPTARATAPAQPSEAAAPGSAAPRPATAGPVYRNAMARILASADRQ